MNATATAHRRNSALSVLAALAIALAGSACETEAPPANTGGQDTASATDTSGGGSDSAGGGDGGGASDGIAVDSTGGADGGGDDANADTGGDDGQIDVADTAGDDASADVAEDTAGTDASVDGTSADSGDGGKADGGGGTSGPDSCIGKCGEYSGEWNCQCDSACESFGDCCSDYAICKCSADADCVPAGDMCKTGGCINGQCQVQSKQCNDGNDCTTDSCDPATGACKVDTAPDNTICTGNGCVDGACKSGVCAPNGNKANGTFCSDASKCTYLDVCKDGQCVGEEVDCDDGNPCTTDACAADTGCSHQPVGDGVTCDDEEDCTEGDKCTTGKCVGTTKADATACDDSDPCSLTDVCSGGVCKGTPADETVLCDDGKLCTNGDACSNGVCKGKSKDCNDGNACTSDGCDSTTGGCKSTPLPEGASCNDGDPCTKGDACLASGCVGLLPACDDNKPCTLDACDDVDGAAKCSHTPIADGGPCEDGDACTVGDVCNAGACKAGGDKCVTAAWQDDFTCGKDNGWVLAPAPASGVATWNVDDKPNPPGYKTAACSLNFNNDTDFDDGHVNGTATSTGVALPAGATVVMAVWSYADVESSANYDVRTIQVSADDFQTVAIAKKLDNGSGMLKKWEKITIDLSKLAGSTVKIRFAFDSVDSISNTGAGWFIDDLGVFAIK